MTRHIGFLQIASGNLRRNLSASIAVLVPLVIIIGVTCSMTFIKAGLAEDARLSMSLIPDITVQRLVAGRVIHFDAAVVDTLAQTGGVRLAAPRAWGYLPTRLGEDDVAFAVMGIVPELMPRPADLDFAIEEGRFLLPGDIDRVVIGKIFAEEWSAGIGDTIEIADPFGNMDRFEVVGIFASAVQIYTADLMLTTIDTARKIFGYPPGTVSDAVVYLDDPSRMDEIAAAMSANMPGYRFLTRDILADLTDQAFGSRSGVFQLLWLILLLTVLLLSWSQASGITFRLRQEVGILKALGWGIMDIIEVKVFESLLLGLAGSLGGLLAGYFYLRCGAPGIKGYLIGWSVIFPDYPLPVYPRIPDIVLLVLLGTLPLIAASAVPAWRIGNIEPDRAMRG